MNAKPWYREPWPWILMSGPATVVLAGAVTAALAVSTSDALVADDYYKQGLGINRVLASEAQARRLGLTAAVAFSPERTRVRVTLGEGPRPDALKLALVHPTKSDQDQAVMLLAQSPGVYEGAIVAPRARAMQLRLEDREGHWRLAARWKTRDESIRLVP